MDETLQRLVAGKNVFLAAHWDADGITSGALIYHAIKDVVKSIKTISKGDVFCIGPEDVDPTADIIITSDIKPSSALTQDVIYIDHHPWDNKEDRAQHTFLYEIFNQTYQSCSLLVYDKIVKNKKDPYAIFLALIGFFGDGGDNMNIPPELEAAAMDAFPELMKMNQSPYGDRQYLEIERYVSLFNTGKRLHWSGQVPMVLFTNLTCYKPFINNTHPLAQELVSYRQKLRRYYKMPLTLEDFGHIQFAAIDCKANVQGVLCARYMHKKPILITNRFNGSIIVSMRVPDNCPFDAGSYLASFKKKIPGLVGGGHEKAGGATFAKEHLHTFMSLIKEQPAVSQ